MENNILLYYIFDVDDNLLNMSTEIIVLNNEGQEVGIETHDFRSYRNIIGSKEFEYKGNIIVGYPLKDDGSVDNNRAYKNFMDYPDSEIFMEDVIKALSNNQQGPAWDDFIECLTNGSMFSIITARGHEDDKIREVIEYIINNELSEDQKHLMYNNLLKFSYIFKGEHDNFNNFPSSILTENKLVKKYLNSCDYIGVSSPSRGGQPDSVEMAKGKAIIEFKNKINNFGKRVGMKVKLGFSDDDLKNVKHIEDLFKQVNHEEFSNIIQYTVKNTNDPNNITKTIRDIK